MALITAAVTTATPVNTTASSGSATAAGNVPVGSSVVAILFGSYSTLPTFGSFTDAAGNTYTVVKQDLATNDIVVGYCSTTTHAITGGTTTYNWSMSSGSMTQANFIVMPFDQPLTAPAAMTITQVSAVTSDSASLTPSASGTTGLFIFGDFGSATGATKSGDGTGFFFSDTTSRALAVGYISPAASTATLTQNILWTASAHTVMHTSGEFTPTVGNVNIAGQRGATAQGAARLGVHTVTPLSITSVVGQRGATARVAARIGQLAVDIPASPTSVRAFSRLGSLSGTIPLVEPAPQRGATARSFSRKGATSVNTIGNVTVRGQRGAVARSFSRAGVATTNNVDVAGERGATLRSFARLGSRFVSSNSTGEATLRVGPSAEVTIREG